MPPKKNTEVKPETAAEGVKSEATAVVVPGTAGKEDSGEDAKAVLVEVVDNKDAIAKKDPKSVFR